MLCSLIRRVVSDEKCPNFFLEGFKLSEAYLIIL
jgi:hypothetical protein